MVGTDRTPSLSRWRAEFRSLSAFRRQDLRPLQRRLMALGLSSLGRAEGRVFASLDTVVLALCGIADTAAPERIRWPSQRQFFRGERYLAQNCREIFGEPQLGRVGRILVTLGTDAAHDPKVIANLAVNGADAVRINCAHDDADIWGKMIAYVRAAETNLGRRIPVLMDIGGPKVRTDNVTYRLAKIGCMWATNCCSQMTI